MEIQRSRPDVDLQQAFFAVEMRPVQAPTRQGIWRNLPRHRAVVDAERDSVLAVVAPEYRLVTNAEAWDLAQAVLARAFQHHKAADLECFALRMPASRSYCEIDFVHPEAMFVVGGRDRWTMFVRLVNSYNRTRSLRMSFGFCRWICQNGLIAGARSVDLSVSHNADLGRVKEELAQRVPDIQALESQFVARMAELQACSFPPERILDLVCHVFELRVPADPSKKRQTAERLCALRDQALSVASAYFDELGPTAYAALNVLTDCASHPQGDARSRLLIDTMERKAGAWAQSMADRLRVEGRAALDDDLANGAEAAKQLKALVVHATKPGAPAAVPSLDLEPIFA